MKKKAIATRTLLILLVVMITLIILITVFVPMISRMGQTANETVMGSEDQWYAEPEPVEEPVFIGEEIADSGLKGA